MAKKQIIAILIIMALIINILLFAMKLIKPLLFWLVLGIAALVSYWLKMKN